MKSIQREQESQELRIRSVMNSIITESKKNINVKIIQSKEITVPMVTGYFKPTIYLPDIPFTDSELKNILLHEWVHFLHKDAWVKLFMFFIFAIFWWNPFIYILKSNLNHILEIRCDLKVTSQMKEEEKIRYLEGIIKIIKYNTSSKIKLEYTKLCNISSLVSVGDSAKIEERFHLVLNSENKKYKPIMFLFYSAVIIAFLISNMFIIQPAYAPEVSKGFEETFIVTPETAYLKVNENGTYALYVNGKYQGKIDLTEISKKPFSLLPIK